MLALRHQPLWCIAFNVEGIDHQTYLDDLIGDHWVCTEEWLFQQAPATSARTIPVIVPTTVREFIERHERRATRQARCIAITPVGADEIAAWRDLAQRDQPLPCGGLLPWERAKFRVAPETGVHGAMIYLSPPNHGKQRRPTTLFGDVDEDISLALAEHIHWGVQGDCIWVGPDDATTLCETLNDLTSWAGQ